MSGSTLPFVTIVMPALDEERYIASAIASVLPDEDTAIDFEVIVADGGSVDATAKIVRLLARGNRAIRLVENVGRTQAAGVNLAARLADPRSSVLVRADCHAGYPADFVVTCVEALAERKSASVVVPMRTVGATCLQRAVAAAQNSRLGNGGAAHRLPGGGSRFVDHGHHAAFDRQAFLAVGGYDETFQANEDAEFDKRLVAAGGRIWMNDAATITYYPRATFPSLTRQYAGYGAGRAATVLKQGGGLRARQMLPLVAFFGCLASLLLGPLDLWLAAPAMLYVTGCMAWGCVMAARSGKPCLALAGLAAITMHMAWAIGFLKAGVRPGTWPLGSAAQPHGATVPVRSEA